MTSHQNPKACKMFCLIRWIEDDMYGVMPLKDAKDSSGVKSQRLASFKWSTRNKRKPHFYEALVLKISDDKLHLNRLLDELVDGFRTEESILEAERSAEESKVDTTTPTRVKCVPLKRPKGKDKLAAAKKRFDEIRQLADSDESIEEIPVHAQIESVPMLTKGGTRALVKNIIRMDKAQPSLHVLKSNPVDVYTDLDANIAMVQKQYKPCPSRYNISVPSPPSSPYSGGFEDDVEDISSHHIEKETSLHCTPLSSRCTSFTEARSTKSTPTVQYGSQQQQLKEKKLEAQLLRLQDELKSLRSERQPTTPATAAKSFQQHSEEIELVKGYGVYLSRMKLDIALGNSHGQPGKLVRKLLAVFFTPEVLAQSSAMGTRKFGALDQSILSAIIKFVTDKHPQFPRTCIIDAVNDKCASYRRAPKTSSRTS